jgi:hypothetical protein
MAVLVTCLLIGRALITRDRCLEFGVVRGERGAREAKY